MVDAVITWVDGNDPAHREKRARYSRIGHSEGRLDTRFASSDELYYCVRSIQKFAPFFRKIFIITDAQHPHPIDPLLQDEDLARKVVVVDHEEIFRGHSDLLPTFNSLSIETLIYRIPDLSEQFVYFNDDFFVARPIAEDFFFDGDLPVLRGRMRTRPAERKFRWKTKLLPWRKPSNSRAQQGAALLAQRTSAYLMLGHYPFALRRSTMQDFFEARPELLRRQISYRFRAAPQISPIGLATQLDLNMNAPFLPPGDVGYIRPGIPTGPDIATVMRNLRKYLFHTFCVQSLDEMPTADRTVIIDALKAHYA